MRYGNVELHNVCSLTETDDKPGFRVSRLPSDMLADINRGARGMSGLTAGCEIRGLLADGGGARMVLQADDDNVTPAVATVYHGDFCAQTVLVEQTATEIVVEYPPKMEAMMRIHAEQQLPFDPRLLRIRLPNIHPIRILAIEGDLTPPTPELVPAKTMLAYGSSITHGASSIPPEGCYAAQCARRLGCDLINLGFGGAAQMDSAIAAHIAGRTDWDFATFEMGINVRDWPLAQFRAAVAHFVSTVVAAHPEKFIFCIDLFTNDSDFGAIPPRGVGFREVVQEIAATYDSGKVLHIDGRTLLTDPSGLRTDLVHPTDNGMQEMGANLAAVVAGTMQG